jgi:hypothetical protein
VRWFGHKPADPVRPIPGHARPEEAREARRESEASLQDARDRWRDVLSIAAQLRRVREVNHFAETVAETMRRRADL